VPEELITKLECLEWSWIRNMGDSGGVANGVTTRRTMRSLAAVLKPHGTTGCAQVIILYAGQGPG